MDWFRQNSDDHRSLEVQFLLDEFSYFGPFFRQTIIEMCVEKIKKNKGKRVTEEDCKFNFHMREVCSAVRSRPTTVRRVLDFWQTTGQLSWLEVGLKINLVIPNLAKSLDPDLQRARSPAPSGAPTLQNKTVQNPTLQNKGDEEEFKTTPAPVSKNGNLGSISETKTVPIKSADRPPNYDSFEIQFDEKRLEPFAKAMDGFATHFKNRGFRSRGLIMDCANVFADVDELIDWTDHKIKTFERKGEEVSGATLMGLLRRHIQDLKAQA